MFIKSSRRSSKYLQIPLIRTRTNKTIFKEKIRIIFKDVKHPHTIVLYRDGIVYLLVSELYYLKLSNKTINRFCN